MIHCRDVSKISQIGKNHENLANEAVDVFQENSDKIHKDIRLSIPQNKISKIPRIKSIKPKSFLSMHEESHVYPV